MIMEKGLKESVKSLRLEGKSYNEIMKILNCSKGTISHHCKSLNLGSGGKEKLSDILISEIKEYYKTHTKNETCEKFNVSAPTVLKYSDAKRKLDTEKERKEKNYKRVKTHRQTIKKQAVEYKGGKCKKCGYDKSIWALDFHHLNESDKDFNISRYSHMNWNIIKKELDKCILICSNCHRELHYLQHNDIEEYNEFIKDFKF